MDAPVVHSRVEGEDENHHEKKSMLKKVKAKAKKLKDSFTGHHQEQEGHQTPDDHDLDEDDDEVDDPDVHGAPIYDSAIRKTDAPLQGDISKMPMRSFGETKAGRDEYDPMVPREERSNVNVSDPMRSNVPGLHGTTDAMHDSAATGRTHVGSDLPGHHQSDRTTTRNEDLLGGGRTKLAVPTSGPLEHEEPKGEIDVIGTHTPYNTPVSSLPHHESYNTATMDVDPVKTVGSGQGGHVGQTREELGKTDKLGEDTPFPKSTPVSSLAHGTHKNTMDVDPKQTFVSGQGGHSDQSRVNLDRPGGLEEDPHSPKANPQAYSPSNYETKVTDPTKSGGAEAGVAPILQSFDKLNLHGGDSQYLNNGANQNPATGSHDQFSPDKPTNQGSSYTEKFSSATSAIADKAILAKNAVASKLGYGGTETEHDDYSRGYVTGAGKSGSSPRQHQNQGLDSSTNELEPAETPQVRGTTVSEHNTTSDLKPSSPTGGTYTEKISSATSAIADRAISAKNVVASKLGYGPSEQVHDSGDVTRNEQSRTTATDQQGKTITSTVYEKVAGAGTAVMSMIPGVSSPTTGRETSPKADGQPGQDKGVSVKDYFVEKLRPGEEDRALSEVISETVQKHKPGVKDQTGHSAGASPKGKVTESEEVRQRLGDTEGNDNFVVEKVKDSVGSMLGGTNKNDEDGQLGLSSSNATGEHRRLQESGN